MADVIQKIIPGTRVQHAKYGAGTVAATRDRGATGISATVQFDDGSKPRDIVADYLTVLGGAEGVAPSITFRPNGSGQSDWAGKLCNAGGIDFGSVRRGSAIINENPGVNPDHYYVYQRGEVHHLTSGATIDELVRAVNARLVNDPLYSTAALNADIDGADREARNELR